MIYLDNNATTPLDPQVFLAIEPFLKECYGNPSSIHQFGQRAKGVLAVASQNLGRILGFHPDELIYTSGATESLNLIVNSLPRGAHVITSSLEHAAVMEPLKCADLSVSYLDPLPGEGSLSPHQVKGEIRSDTRALILSAVNNETGVVTDLSAFAALASEMGVPLIVDGVSGLSHHLFPLPRGISAICFSGHKIHAPLGVGLLALRKGVRFNPRTLGGGQQRGMRAGTENLPGIVGLAKAFELLSRYGNEYETHMRALHHLFETRLKAHLPDCVIHGESLHRTCHTSNIAFPGLSGETLVMALDLEGVACSHGAACSTGSLEPSRVLLNMGIPLDLARSSVRFSLSRFTTREDIHHSIDIISKVVSQLVSLHTRV